jgi:hypothetical protein
MLNLLWASVVPKHYLANLERLDLCNKLLQIAYGQWGLLFEKCWIAVKAELGSQAEPHACVFL